MTEENQALNARRVAHGANAIERFMDAIDEASGDADPETALVDLLADLMHWAHAEHGADYFEKTLDMARIHFNEELSGEE